MSAEEMEVTEKQDQQFCGRAIQVGIVIKITIEGHSCLSKFYMPSTRVGFAIATEYPD